MITGTYLNNFMLNGTLIAQPTEHGWSPRTEIGVDGNGVSVYVAPREYFLKWDFLDTDEFQQIYSFFLAQGVTGSIVSFLPQWDVSPYGFYAYSGTILREPEFDGWFQNYAVNVKLLIVKIIGT